MGRNPKPTKSIWNMATATKPQRGEKSAFIRQHPQLKAGELVAEAKKAGINLTPTQIYNCWAIDKKKGRKQGKRKNEQAFGSDLGNSLVIVATTVKKLGGIENVKQALRLIE
jgi:hypothetical protein